MMWTIRTHFFTFDLAKRVRPATGDHCGAAAHRNVGGACHTTVLQFSCPLYHKWLLKGR